MTTYGTQASTGASTRARHIRRVLLITLGLNLAVAFAKVIYGYLANTLAIRADGFHSLADAANNVIGLVGITLSARPADDDHPYGHQKFEVVAAMIIGVSLMITAFEVGRSAIARFLDAAATPPNIGVGAFAVLGATLAVNVAVSMYERRRGRELHSPFLVSDAMHTLSDALVTLGVLVTVVLIRVGYGFLDIVAALVIAGFIAHAGLQVLRENFGYLVDKALLDPDEVQTIATNIDGVASAHKVRTRGTPNAVCIDLHIQITKDFDVVEAHRVTHEVADALKRELPMVSDVVIHTEPAMPGESVPAQSAAPARGTTPPSETPASEGAGKGGPKPSA